jgi:hypothetical protein
VLSSTPIHHLPRANRLFLSAALQNPSTQVLIGINTRIQVARRESLYVVDLINYTPGITLWHTNCIVHGMSKRGERRIAEHTWEQKHLESQKVFQLKVIP